MPVPVHAPPPLAIGWHIQDPGPPPRSPLLDTVPWSNDRSQLPALHDRWRRAVEADNRRLAAGHAKAKIWYPVVRPQNRPVVPFYGGSPATWAAAVGTITSSLVATGYARIRIINLSRHDILQRFFQARRLHWSGISVMVSAAGSELDLFRSATVDDLAGLIVDVLRTTPDHQGRLDAGRDKQKLLEIAAMLGTPKTLERLSDAVGLALTGRARAGSSFTPAEQTALLDYHVVQVKQRRQLADSLDRLQHDLSMLRQFERDPARAGRVFGSGPRRVTGLAAEATASIADQELGRELLSRFVARQASRTASRTTGPEAVLVVGADHLAPEVLNSLTGSAHRNGLQLLLFFERLTGPGEQLLGAAGSPFAVFLTLPNPDDAQKAAAFIGHEYTFVVNGYSVADGSSEEWSTGRQVGTDQTTTRSWNYGQGFGSSVARGLSRSNSTTTTSGGGRSTTSTVSLGRVHEYVLEPEELMRLPDGAMLVIERDQAMLAFCDPAIAALPVTVSYP
jgi:hypothetical protein